MNIEGERLFHLILCMIILACVFVQISFVALNTAITILEKILKKWGDAVWKADMYQVPGPRKRNSSKVRVRGMDTVGGYAEVDFN